MHLLKIKPAYYNEFDKYAAQWLRNLILWGHIAPGDVDDRDLLDVKPDDIKDYTQVHFCAGIGIWSHALRLARWPDDRAIWTGSFPCQPFSSAGARAGMEDLRHIWPAGFHLYQQCRPAVFLGEQVASKDAEDWLDVVSDDVEGMGAAFGAVAFPSASSGAPHIRDRTYWAAITGSLAGVGDAYYSGLSFRECLAVVGTGGRKQGRAAQQPGGASGGVADIFGKRVRNKGRRADAAAPAGVPGEGLQRERVRDDAGADGDDAALGLADSHGACDARQRADSGHGAAEGGVRDGSADSCVFGGLADTPGGLDVTGGPWADQRGLSSGNGSDQGCADAGPTNGFWRAADWLLCRDGKWRPVEPGTFPLVVGDRPRVGRLRAYGNAINPWQAKEWIESVMEAIDGPPVSNR